MPYLDIFLFGKLNDWFMSKKLVMSRLRSVLAVVLVVFASFFFSFGSFAAKKPATYTPAQVQLIKKYEPRLAQYRGRMDELQTLIKQREWVNVGSFIHGPLGQLRQDIGYLNRNLLPKDQPQAREAAKNLFVDLEAIDKAAEAGNYSLAVQQYNQALNDFDAYLKLVPQV